jgi:hypothetical protein
MKGEGMTFPPLGPKPSGYGQLYDLETFPVTVADGSFECPFACPNKCGEDQGQRLRELKILQQEGPMISILQCRSCMKRWLRVEYRGECPTCEVAQKAEIAPAHESAER